MIADHMIMAENIKLDIHMYMSVEIYIMFNGHCDRSSGEYIMDISEEFTVGTYHYVFFFNDKMIKFPAMSRPLVFTVYFLEELLLAMF